MSTGPGVRQVGASRLLCRVNDMLQSVLVLGRGSSRTYGDGGGEDGLSDGCVKVRHHCL